MAKNPYICNNFPGKFTIAYEGETDGMHAYRIGFKGHDAMDVQMFKVDVWKWLLECANGRYFCGNGSIQTQHPALPFADNGTDFFVLFEDFADMVEFEMKFNVVGYTPTLAA